jgi:hypothetical protein
MPIISDILPEDISIEREMVLHHISTLASASELASLDDASHLHNIADVSDLYEKMSGLAGVSHNHKVSDFPILSKITNKFSHYNHTHDISSLQLIRQELNDTQKKINSLQIEIQKSISIVEQLLNKK